MNKSEPAETREQTDVVVVGAGLGGLAVALAAATRGLRVIVLEKSELVGGAAAYSGGQVWVADSHVEQGDGIADSLADAEAYIRAMATDRPELLEDASLHRWLTAAPEAVKYFEDLGAVTWEVIRNCADYHESLPGWRAEGRYLTATFDATKLGPWRDRLRISPHFPVGFTYADLYEQGAKNLSRDEDDRPLLLSALGSNEFGGDPSARLTFGPGVVGGFLARAVQEDNLEIRLERRVVQLLRDDTGIVGVRVADPAGGISEIAGKVVLATSGFDWNPELIERYLGLSAEDSGALSPKSITGDGLLLAEAVGAARVEIPAVYYPLALSVLTNAEPPFKSLREYGLPHTFCVDQSGNRFTDDGTNWGLSHSVLDPQRPHPKFFMIWDEQHHEKYGLGDTPPGGTYPAAVVSAPTLRELGGKLDIDGDQLEKTAQRFNEFAEHGEDPDFGRGTNLAWNKFTGDPTHQPNPNVGPVVKAPFFAARLRLATAGICLTGIHVDADGQVLDPTGAVIAGLYAIGSCAAFTTSGTGYNSGFALSRAVTHAYLVANLLTGQPAQR